MSAKKSLRYGQDWNRDEQILALYLYCQISFKKTKANNPEVIKFANLLGRTPSSVARKLGNFGAFDSRLAAQGIVVSESEKLLEKFKANPAFPNCFEIHAR